MPENWHVSVFLAKFRNQFNQCVKLGLREIVDAVAFCVNAADKANSDTVCVVSLTMRADYFNWSPVFNCSVNLDNVVISDVLPPKNVNVVFADSFGIYAFFWLSCGTMNND